MRTSGCKRRNLHLVHVLLLLLWCTVHCVQARSGRRLSRSVTVKSDKRSISLDNLNELAQVVELATAPLPTPPSEEAINPLWVPDETSERLMLKRADADQEPLIKSLVEKELTKRLASFQRLISKSLFADHSGLYRTERAGAKQRAPIAPDDESKRATLNNDQSLDYLTTENPDFDDYESPVHMKQQDGEDEGMMQTMLNYFRGWSLTPFESKQDRRIRELMESVAQLKKRSHYNEEDDKQDRKEDKAEESGNTKHVWFGKSKVPDVVTVISVLLVLVGVVMCSGYWFTIRPKKARKKMTLSGTKNRSKDEYEG